MRGLSFVSVALIVAFVGCAPPAQEAAPPPPAPTSQPSAEIRALSASWVEAMNAGDVESLTALYTDDARVLPPNAEIGQGHEAIAAVFGEMIEAGLSGTLETIEAVSAADIGYHVGTYTLTLDGEEADRGKFIEVWRQVDGEWKISHDMFSSDLPAPAP